MRAMGTSAMILARSTGTRSVSGGFRSRTRRRMLIARRRRRVVRLSSRSRRMAFLILLPLLRGLARSFVGRSEQFGRMGVDSHGLGEMVVGVFGRLLGAWAPMHFRSSFFRSRAGQWRCAHSRVRNQVTLITGTEVVWGILNVILTYVHILPKLLDVDERLSGAFTERLLQGESTTKPLLRDQDCDARASFSAPACPSLLVPVSLSFPPPKHHSDDLSGTDYRIVL